MRLVSEKTARTANITGKGDFQANQLKPDTFRLLADLPGEHVYLKSMSGPKRGEIDRKGIDIKFGEPS